MIRGTTVSGRWQTVGMAVKLTYALRSVTEHNANLLKNVRRDRQHSDNIGHVADLKLLNPLVSATLVRAESG